MKLTQEQSREIQNGEPPVRVVDPTTGDEYVLIRADVYQRIRNVCYDDSGELSNGEMDFLLSEAGKQAGWFEPEMDVYDNYDAEIKKLRCQ